MRRRVIALVAALALAGVGTVVLVSFVRSAEDRAGAGEAEVTAWRVSPLAEAPLGSGTRVGEAVEAGLLEEASVDQDSVPLGYVTTVEDKLDKLLLVDVAPGEILADTKLGDVVVDDSRAGNVDVPVVEIPDGYVQVPVRFEPEQALGGLIQPGNEVAVIATFQDYIVTSSTEVTVGEDGVVLPDAAGADGSGEQSGAATDVLLDRALVSAVQTDVAPVFQEEGSDAVLTPPTEFLITFAVSPEDAKRLVYAASQGKLWLAYSGDTVEPDEAGIISLSNVFGGEG